MTILTTEQEVLDLPENSVIVLTQERGWLMDTDIYRSWSAGRWQQQDPGDRDDGERNFTSRACGRSPPSAPQERHSPR